MQTLLSVDEARQIVLDHLPEASTTRCAFDAAIGRTLAQPVVSREAIPPFRNAAMDGFAVRTSDLTDLPVRLPVAFEIPAGVAPTQPVASGTCARIMTGAPFPEGADAVAPVEWTEADGDTIVFLRAPEAGQYVRPAGKDVRAGQKVFAAGTVVTPPVVGMLATVGYAEVEVRVPPRVAVVATGDELVAPSEPLGPGQIRNSSGPAVVAQVCDAGGYPLGSWVARDTEAHTRAVLEEALDADVLVLCGGVSMGAYDVVKTVLDDLGTELFFWKVRQKPGKPLAFGLLEGRPVFALPGNPVSSAVCVEQYVRPALAKMLGRQAVLRPRHAAVLAEAFPKRAGRHHFARAVASVSREGCLEVRSTGPQDSNLYSSVVRANCIAHLPEAMEDPPAGTRVEIEWLRWR